MGKRRRDSREGTQRSRRTMKMSELIQQVGDEHVSVQNLDHCLISAQAKGAKGEIRFGTPAANVVDLLKEKPGRIGLIVWMPRDRVEAASKEGQA